MKNLLILVLVVGLFTACSSKTEEIHADMSHSGMPGEQKSSFMARSPASMVVAEPEPESDLRSENERNSFLAYEHSVEVTVPHKELQTRYNALAKRCLDDKEFSCVLLNSTIQGGDYASANLRMRIKPQGVEGFIESASEKAELTSQSTHADDLTDRVMDVEKRLEQLQSYRDKLIALEEKSADDIDALIKVATQLSQTQTQLEYTQGEKATLYKRIQSDILNIYLRSDQKESAWFPLGEALGDFAENLADGLATFITAFAYLLPWMLFLIALFYVFRYLWKRRRKK